MTGTVVDHEHLLVAGAALRAMPLRTGGRLAAWLAQESLDAERDVHR